jgi:hypothetical protein
MDWILMAVPSPSQVPPNGTLEAPLPPVRGFFMVGSVGATHPWPLAVGELDACVSTSRRVRSFQLVCCNGDTGAVVPQ